MEWDWGQGPLGCLPNCTQMNQVTFPEATINLFDRTATAGYHERLVSMSSNLFFFVTDAPD